MRARASTSQLVGFRLAGHGLAAPLGPDLLLDAAARCGVQNSPPGGAILSLHARTGSLTRDAFTAAIADERTLLQTWSMRGAPYVFPASDAARFTTGVLPPTEAAARRFLPGVVPALDALGLTVAEATDLVEAEIADVLAGRALDIHELGTEIAPRIARRLATAQRAQWNEEGPHAPGQSVGEAVVHFLMRILCLRGVVWIAPREENRARFELATAVGGGRRPAADPHRARAELLRGYLRAYGPATRASFAAWVGVGAGDAAAWWDLVADELAAVDTPAGEAWLLASDLPALAAAERPGSGHGPLMLPPGDPYLRVRDRDTIVAPEHQRRVWRTVGGPGVVLAAGEVVGTWRPRKRGAKLTVDVEPFTRLAASVRAEIAEAVERIGPLRGATTTETRFAED